MNLSLEKLLERGESWWRKTTTRGGAQTQPGIGIDLGTTYSCVGVWQHGRIEIITNDLGNRTTPSCVAFTQSRRLIGDAAKNQASINSTNTIFDAKRLIGRKFNESTVENDMKLWPFKVIETDDNKPAFVVTYKDEEKQFSAEEISSMILSKMKETAETYLGNEVKDAVITVPAYFNDAQRQATKDAGVIAGLNVLRIINEPTAAAIAYGLDKQLTSDNNKNKNRRAAKNILVFDLGGGTFDVSIVSIRKDVFEVKAVSGDTHLGGGDFDTRLVGHFIAEFERKHKKKKVGENARALGRLRAACERAKRSLSTTTEASIEIDCLFDGIDFCSTITRARFENLNMDLFERCLEPVKKCLEDGKMGKHNIDDIVLVGGSTRIPKVQQMLQVLFDGKELCRGINADEAVAYGAASHAAILAGVGDLKDTVLADVTPLSLGVEVLGKVMHVVIPRNTSVPTKVCKKLYTSEDNQVAAGFRVFEGEGLKVEDNYLLGQFSLYDIPPRPKGRCEFDVCFEMDVDSILTVSATLVGSIMNKKQISITKHSGRLTKEVMERMVKESERYKADDEAYGRVVKAKSSLERYIGEVTTMMRQCDDTISEKEKRLMREAVERSEGWLDWNHLCEDVGMLEQKKDELEKVCGGLLRKMHDAAAAAARVSVSSSSSVDEKAGIKAKGSELNDVD